MFEGNRVIARCSDRNGRVEWYFQAREGLIGPYESEEKAEECLRKFVQHRIRLGLDGGRSRQAGLTAGTIQSNQRRASSRG